jgi:iron complex transport system ATP-binding protein
MNESVRIDDVNFSYETRQILKHVSLGIREGEVVSVIGPNGAGKSTLVVIAMGLLNPQRGTVNVNGRPLSQWAPRELARYCAFVPQNPYLPPAFTVWESVFLGRTPYRKIGEISGGERQRVILARALAQEPRCLFLDEPTNFLDVHHQVMLLSFVRRLAEEESVTVFIVLHDLNIASTFSDRIVLLANGEIVVQGTPSEVLQDTRIVSLYENSITVFQRPDDEARPAMLPVRVPAHYGNGKKKIQENKT